MGYVLKISKEGYDVKTCDTENGSKNQSGNESKNKDTSNARIFFPQLLALLSRSYILGARMQVQRYKDAYKVLEQNPKENVFRCFHEVTMLLEDLNIISKYIKKCEYGKVEAENDWLDIRNHICHDIRDNFDQKNHKQKHVRAKKLGVHACLVMDIEFAIDTIRVGKKKLKLENVDAYIIWAEKVFEAIIKKAKEDGRIAT